MRIKKNSGFTLIELIVVIAVLGILALIAIPNILGYVEEAKISADKATLRTLNNVTTMYKVESSNFNADVFSGINEDENRMLELVDNGYLSNEISPQQKDARFQWEVNNQIWRIYVNNVVVPLTPLGSDFTEISSGMISKIIQRKNDTGGYGRTWGDYKYTDIGLDPEDWKDPILHLSYIPKGKELMITPEKDYRINITNDAGEVKTVYYGHNLIYDTEKEKWFYHSNIHENEVDIDTIQIVKYP